MRDFDGKRVQLKWANDIFVDGRKVSGVLCDGIWSGNNLKGIVIGVGMNINQEYFSEEIAARAIALKHILKFSIPLEQARNLLLATLQYTLTHYSSSAVLINDLRSELEWMHGIKNFSLSLPDGTKADGLRYDGITDDGALIVIAEDGSRRIYQNATLNFS
jgi:BirA family biotin operon repressor/biotin-[acetyl-CoA-carboxylase] ligase